MRLCKRSLTSLSPLVVIFIQHECPCALCHRHTRTGDRVRLVEVLDGLSEGLATDACSTGCTRNVRKPDKGERGACVFRDVVPHERGRDLPHPVANSEDIIVRQRRADHLAQCTNDLPIFAAGAGRWDCRTTELGTALGVDPCRTLLGVRSAWKADVCELGAEVAVVALVDDERVLGDACRVDLICVEKVNELGLGSSSLLRRDEANLIRRCTGSSL